MLPIQPDARTGKMASMTVAWTGIALTDKTGTTLLITDDFVVPVILDSGITLIRLPRQLFDQMAAYFSVVV